MTKILFIIFLCLSIHNASGQTIAEWTKQKKTQIKYLQQQIAALQMYINYGKKGYEIAYNGLSLIDNIKSADFKLAADYFQSLRLINPKVKEYSRIIEIISMQKQVVKLYKSSMRKLKESGQFSTYEIGYAQGVFIRLLEGTTDNINELIGIITPGMFLMKDDERLNKIDQVYRQVQDKLIFAHHFRDETLLLAMQRRNETRGIERLQMLNNKN